MEKKGVTPGSSDRLKNDLTSEEIDRYWNLYFAALDTLIVAHAKLRELENMATNLGDRSRYRGERLGIEIDIELMRRKRVAFTANGATISPPDQSMAERVLQLSREIARKAAQSSEAPEIVRIATTALGQFGKIQKS